MKLTLSEIWLISLSTIHSSRCTHIRVEDILLDFIGLLVYTHAVRDIVDSLPLCI